MNYLNPLKRENLPTLFGFSLFVAMMAAGYYYNLTFVQLGLEDFGTRELGLSPASSALNLAFLAIITCLIALGFGWWMQRRGLARQFRFKLRAAFGVVLAQTTLTFILPRIGSAAGYQVWLLFTSCALGIGVPATFSLTVDLVPVRLRGTAAALITALSYFAAETLSAEWTFEFFQMRLIWVLAAGTLGLGVLVVVRHPWLDILARQHLDPDFSHGRFLSRSSQRPDRKLVFLLVLMFGIYFVDSLGFLRLIKVPGFMEATWQSPLLGDRLFIAGIHLVGALIGGVLYNALSARHLFLWIFGLLALTHLQYSLHLQATGETLATLAMPMLYAIAVSLYTVVNFAVWADLSTSDTISFNSSLGVALSAWTATFFSTGLAIYLQGAGVSLIRHIQIVDGLAMLLFVAVLFLIYFDKSRGEI
jgi:MFS family permease